MTDEGKVVKGAVPTTHGMLRLAIMEFLEGRDRVTVTQIISQLFGLEPNVDVNMQAVEAQRIGGVLRELGWPKIRMGDPSRGWTYVRAPVHVSEWQAVLAEHVSNISRRNVTVHQLLVECFHFAPGASNPQGWAAQCVGRALKALGWRKFRTNKPPRIWMWERPQ